MKVGLFIPCYIDQFYPQVGVASLQILERLGCEVDYPLNQTCCGQPLGNAGYEMQSKDLSKKFIETFEGFDYIVAPSGSCVHHVKSHYGSHGVNETEAVSGKIFELSEFIIDVLKIEIIDSSFSEKVGIHESCHGLRGLKLGTASELMSEPINKTRRLLERVEGIELIDLERKDECCGFGGTFSVTEEAISVKMGRDRIKDHIDKGIKVITGTDMSCLMHLEGLIRREQLPIRVMHFSEILNHQK